MKEDRQDIDETPKKLGSLEELQMSLIDSPMLIRTAKEATATLNVVLPDIVETKGIEKDSLYGDTEGGPIDKGAMRIKIMFTLKVIRKNMMNGEQVIGQRRILKIPLKC